MAKRQKKDTPSVFDYRDVKTLQRYTNVYGQIESIAKTGLTEKQQRSLAHTANLEHFSAHQGMWCADQQF